MRNSTTNRLQPRSTMARLTTATLLTAVALGAGTASAYPRLCGQYDSVNVASGRYVVQNNNWGDTTTQCIDPTDTGFAIRTASHNKPTEPAPGGYPSIYAGCHWGHCSAGSGLPMKVSDPGFSHVTTSVSMSYPASGKWDAAYDIWFDPTARTTGQNTGAELMIWLNNAGGPRPSSSTPGPVATVWIAGSFWQVWVGNIGWPVVSYVRTSAASSISFSVKDFYNDMKTRIHTDDKWYLTSVQVGFEPWVGGAGLAVNNFTYNH